LSVEGVVVHVLKRQEDGWSLCQEVGDTGSL
jgi:hypothetical protein